MCGIVGYLGSKAVVPFLLEGLYTLEYRGYDSAGVAVIEGSELEIVKRSGEVAALEQALRERSLQGSCGIGHTRWATHGAPTEQNAHPHFDAEKSLAIVHNGIIENSYELRKELCAAGYSFVSETDTETIAHLLKLNYLASSSLEEAFRKTIERLKGSYAIVALHKDHPHMLCVARKGSPLVVAPTAEGIYVASDTLALAKQAKQYISLDNGQYGFLYADKLSEDSPYDACVFYNEQHEKIMLELQNLGCLELSTACEGFPDFMLKEIHEQPQVLDAFLRRHISGSEITLGDFDISSKELKELRRIYIVSCGTSYYASQLAKNYLEYFMKIPVEINVASEFNYQHVLVDGHTLCMIITQSGETADTLTAARKMKSLGASVYAITNVVGSSAARESDGVLYTMAGPEVSVASTKSYTAQVLALMLFALRSARELNTVSEAEYMQALSDLQGLSTALSTVIERADQAQRASSCFEKVHSALFLGRGLDFATACEGALKLKELSYIHAEAYPAGEMKHGPIALLEPGFPVVVLIPQDDMYKKTLSNIEEITARGAEVIALATEGDTQVEQYCSAVMWLPKVSPLLSGLINVVYLQLFAREVALLRGKNVDRPRNLAKSVTVE